MKVSQIIWTKDGGWAAKTSATEVLSPQLILAFGSLEALQDPAGLDSLRKQHPAAVLVACSSAGEICGDRLLDNTIVATAIAFTRSQVRSATVRLSPCLDSYRAGVALAQALPREVAADGDLPAAPLKHVFVLADGLACNAATLVDALVAHLPPMTVLTGGLAADGVRFQETLVIGAPPVSSGTIACVGIYSQQLQITAGAAGGWCPFGPERLVTRARGNVLYELDGRPALELYKKYLGEHAKGLPGTGLYFPLGIRAAAGGPAFVRAFLSVNEAEQSMTFPGDMPEGSYVRLMKSNCNRLLDGAVEAARRALPQPGLPRPEFALIVSCVARRQVLRQRAEEEIEAIREIFGPQTLMTGFCSYGEMGPFATKERCMFHNQTVVATTWAEP
jgi:hypothetical protein